MAESGRAGRERAARLDAPDSPILGISTHFSTGRCVPCVYQLLPVTFYRWRRIVDSRSYWASGTVMTAHDFTVLVTIQ